MTFEELWRLTKRYWLPILTCAIVGVLLAGLFTITRTPTYQATSTAYVVGDSDGATSGAGYANSLAAQTKAKAWLPLFSSSAVAQRVIDDMGLDMTAAELASRIAVTVEEDSPAVTVRAEANTAVGARDIADAVVKETGAEVTRIEGDNPGARIQTVSSAALPAAPSYPRPERIIPIGLLVGLVIGYGVALVRRRRDTFIRLPEDVEQHADTSVLAVIPATNELERGSGQRHSFQTREALRQLRTNVRFVDVDHSPRTIVVTSARMGEGKSTTAANLATVLAEAGESVMLIDADLRRPTVATTFGLESAVGLTQVLAGTVTLPDAIQATRVEGLSVIAAGQIPPNPSELLGSQRMRALLEQLKQDYTVILDAPPLLPVTDAALLIANADGCLLVVSADATRQEHLHRAVSNIKRVDGRVLGAVLNNVQIKALGRIVYGETQYGKYGNYGYGEYGDSTQTDATATAQSADSNDDTARVSRREVKQLRSRKVRK